MPLRPVDIPPAFALRAGGDQNAFDQRELAAGILVDQVLLMASSGGQVR
jgi:hypothetical protein